MYIHIHVCIYIYIYIRYIIKQYRNRTQQRVVVAAQDVMSHCRTSVHCVESCYATLVYWVGSWVVWAWVPSVII